MGGLFLLGSIVVAMFFSGNFLNPPTQATIFVTFSYFLLGFLDDYLKVWKKNTDGVSGKVKLLWQFLTAFLVGYFLIDQGVIDTKLYIPFFKGPLIDLHGFYIVFVAIVIVGSSNAVNLTDGLDGLAIGPIITSAASLGLLAYAAGHKEISQYLYTCPSCT